jgi:CheY-like chemotaxis protein
MTKILLAEDNDFVRMQINRFLVDDGYEVVEAPDGLTALNLIDESIKLAIVDIRMEPIDGLEFTKSLRAKNNSTPVIFITGDQSPDLLSEASKLGVKATLMKPVEKDRLLKMVARSIPQTI